MRRFSLVAALLAFGVPALAQVDAKVEKELQTAYKSIVTAMKKKDVPGLMKHMTEDATMTEGGRTLKRAEFEPFVRQQIQLMDVKSSKLKFTKVVAKDGTAKTEYIETMAANMQVPGAKPSLMETVAKYRTTFKKVDGEWKMKSSETIGSPKVKMNGKPFKFPTAPPTPSTGVRK
jgi:ketosteroid isomerase-like protein